MARILVLVEALDGTASKASTEVLTLARSLGEPAARRARGARHLRRRRRGASPRTAPPRRTSPRARPSPTTAPVPKAEVLSQLAGDLSPGAVLRAVDHRGQGDRGPARRPARLGPHHRRRGGDRQWPGASLPRKASSVGRRSSSPGWSRAPRSSPCGSARLPRSRRAEATQPDAQRRTTVSRAGQRDRHRTARGSPIGSPGAGRGGHRRLRRPGHRRGLRTSRAARGRPGRGRRRIPGRDRRRLVPALLPGRPDRQDGLTVALRRRAASPARSSTGRACRPPRRSSPSTRTPRPRSSSWRTSGWSATCSPCCRKRSRHSGSVRASRTPGRLGG